MEPARGDGSISINARQGSNSCSNFGRRSATGHEAAYSLSGIGEGQSEHHLQVSVGRTVIGLSPTSRQYPALFYALFKRLAAGLRSPRIKICS